MSVHVCIVSCNCMHVIISYKYNFLHIADGSNCICLIAI